jgi:hypothetical protein
MLYAREEGREREPKKVSNKICAENVKCFLNKEQVDSSDANEIHEKQSERL